MGVGAGVDVVEAAVGQHYITVVGADAGVGVEVGADADFAVALAEGQGRNDGGLWVLDAIRYVGFAIAVAVAVVVIRIGPAAPIHVIATLIAVIDHLLVEGGGLVIHIGGYRFTAGIVNGECLAGDDAAVTVGEAVSGEAEVAAAEDLPRFGGGDLVLVGGGGVVVLGKFTRAAASVPVVINAFDAIGTTDQYHGILEAAGAGVGANTVQVAVFEGNRYGHFHGGGGVRQVAPVEAGGLKNVGYAGGVAGAAAIAIDVADPGSAGAAMGVVIAVLAGGQG